MVFGVFDARKRQLSVVTILCTARVLSLFQHLSRNVAVWTSNLLVDFIRGDPMTTASRDRSAKSAMQPRQRTLSGNGL